eukprot:NODE_23570_length_660_cov_4.313321.p1 GENE.NODE_23570_length_660_cov_4.313321~~NODE_23570_length_660_cov_4.313321.p1  ORF type:complete len:144 (-),score=37.88 NODE_23570_length_660_cov_4.313321:229-606(-)
MTFKLRPLEEYHEKIWVAWAKQASGPDGKLTPMSRGRPAMDLSLAMITEFVKQWLPVSKSFTVSEAPVGCISFTDVIPFVSEWRLSKVLKKGTLLTRLDVVSKLDFTLYSNQFVVLEAGVGEGGQ